MLIDSNRKLLGNISSIAWNDLPLDYLDTWTQQVGRVTVQDIKSAFAQKGTSINSFFGRIAALRGARNPHVPEVRSGSCAPCALHFIPKI